MKVIELIHALSELDALDADIKVMEGTGTSHISDVVYWPNSNTVVIAWYGE